MSNIDPYLTFFTHPHAMLDKAMSVLASRILAEPWAFSSIATQLHPAMFDRINLDDDRICAAAWARFVRDGSYSIYAISQDLHMDFGLLSKQAQRHGDTPLTDAFVFFKTTYGQYREILIAQKSFAEAVGELSTPEEIRIMQDRMRKEFGLLSSTSPDGRDDFEQVLLQKIEGRVVEQPIRPPLQSLRQHFAHYELGEYVILAARPGIGKSQFAIQHAYHTATGGHPCAYINHENTPKDVWRRLWQMRNSQRLRDLPNDQGEHARALQDWEYIKSLPIKVLHPGRSLSGTVGAIRQDFYERGSRLFIIDYVQLMKDGGQKRGKTEEIAEISAELRSLALDLMVVIIVVAMISREAEKSVDKRPDLSQLKWAGELEQDATTALLLYVPSNYGLEVDPETSLPFPEKYAEIEVAKGRNTGTALVKCRFDDVRGFYDEDDFAAVASSQFPVRSSQAFTPDTAEARAAQVLNANRTEPDEDVPF